MSWDRQCWLSRGLGSFVAPKAHSSLPKHPYTYNTVPQLRLQIPHVLSSSCCLQDHFQPYWWSGALQPPCTAQCNHNTFIYQSEVYLQEAALKTPHQCIHSRSCTNLVKAQTSVRSNKPCSGFIFVAVSCPSVLPQVILELSNPSLAPYPTPRPCKSGIVFYHTSPTAREPTSRCSL